MGKRDRRRRTPQAATVSQRGELWLIVDWFSGERVAWGPWRSWSRFRTAVASWRKEPKVTAVRVLDRRPSRALADEWHRPAGAP